MLSLFFGFMILGIIAASTGPLIPWILQDFGLTYSSVGLVFLLLGLGRIISSLFLGAIGSRLEDTRMVQVGILLMGSVCLVFFVLPSFLMLLFTMLVLGLGWGLMESGSNAIVGRIHYGKSGGFLNRLHSFFGVGALLGPILASTIATFLHWRFLYLLLSAFFCLFWFSFRGQESQEEKAEKTPADFRLVVQPLFLTFFVVLFFYVSQESGLAGWLNTYLEQRFSTSQLTASLVVTIFWIAFTLGRGSLSLLLNKVSRMKALKGMLLSLALCFFLLFFSQGVVLSAILLVFVGLSMAGIFPTVASLAMDSFPGKQLSVSGFLSAGAGLGVMVGPFFAGVIWDSFSITVLPLWGLLYTGLVYISFCLLGKQRKKEKARSPVSL